MIKKVFIFLVILIPHKVFSSSESEFLKDFIKFHPAKIEIECSSFDSETFFPITCCGYDNKLIKSENKTIKKDDEQILLRLLGVLQKVEPTKEFDDFFNHRITASSAFMQLAELFSAIARVNRPRELRDSLMSETKRTLDENTPVLETSQGKVYKLEPFIRIFKDFIVTTPTEKFVYFKYYLPIDVRAKITFYPMSLVLTPKVMYLGDSYIFFDGNIYYNTEEFKKYLSEY